MTWTTFMDMHSGGNTKEPPYETIYIEAPEKEACLIFYNRFSHNPWRVTCTCCGEDYSIVEYPTLEKATKYLRKKDASVEEFEAMPEVLAIHDGDIRPEERLGELPIQGYVWQ